MLAFALLAFLGAAEDLQHPCAVRVHVENDAFVGRDKHYTNGIRVEGTGCGPSFPWDPALLRLGRAWFDHEASAGGFVIGNNIYTPLTYSSTGLDPSDRPYAGWLYAGLLRSYWRGRNRYDFEFDVGVTGRPSLSGELQAAFHRLLGVPRFEHWHNQIPAAPVVRLSLAAELELLQFPRVEAQATRLGGWRWFTFAVRGRGEVGNLLDRASAGIVVRFGRIADGSALAENNPSFQLDAAPTGEGGGRRAVFWELFGYWRTSFSGVVLNGFITGVPLTARRSATEARAFVTDTDVGLALGVGPLALSAGWAFRSTEIGRLGDPWRWDEHSFVQLQVLYAPERTFAPGPDASKPGG